MITEISSEQILRQFEQAQSRRSGWENLWQDCYEYALPQRQSFYGTLSSPNRRNERLYDGTALDATDQLAASLLGYLTPPMTPWFGFKPGPDLSAAEAEKLSPLLEKSARIMQSHFDQSNFAMEMHQSYLDLVVGGTASLLFEEAEAGQYSAFRFASVPLQDVVLEEGRNGFLDTSWRILRLTQAQISARYPLVDRATLGFQKNSSTDPHERFDILEGVIPADQAYHYVALMLEGGVVLANRLLPQSPFINFRWMKSAGEIYGRSPIMKSLPDIKTANKVVELILKNASIAVTGIWQAEDDGILNPANIELVPGAIIPKAMGSKGLTPLEMPGRFDVSQLVLDDLRARIRHALLVDRLSQISGPKMTATEILERSSEMALLLGATYGRLQSELLTPLIQRGYQILRRRGEVPDLLLDGRIVMIDYRSPLARAQAQRYAAPMLTWIENIQALSPEAKNFVNAEAAVRQLADLLGVPSHLIKTATTDISN